MSDALVRKLKEMTEIVEELSESMKKVAIVLSEMNDREERRDYRKRIPRGPG